jgi:hypothetical protein
MVIDLRSDTGINRSMPFRMSDDFASCRSGRKTNV